jgi:CRP-like cAMP-binding protein
MSDADIGALFPHMHEVSLRAGMTLYEADDPVPAVLFPSTAVLSAVTVMKDGGAVETSTIGCESVAGLLPALSNTPTPTRIFAQIGGSALRMSSELLRRRCRENGALMDLMLRAVEANAAQADQAVACNALHEPPQRLARWLLHTEDRTGSSVFPLTQEYMAVMVGVQRTTISAIASKLKTDGLIYYSRGVMEIRDREGLKAAACECYATLRARYAALGIETAEDEPEPA